MPADPKDHLGKDHYNRRHLDELIPQQQTKVDQMQHQFDDLARKAYMGDTNAAAAASNLAPQLQAAKKISLPLARSAMDIAWYR